MPEKISPILNKYDVYNVEDTFNTFLIELVEKNLEGEKSEKKEYIKLFIRFLISVFILLSYFHATPFPLDKPLIAVCTLIYFILNYILEYYQEKIMKGSFAEFYVSNKKFNNKKISLKPVLSMKSKVEIYSNKY